MNLKDKLGLLGATIFTLGVVATPAFAQDAQEGASEEDVIVVTGSRLRRETFDSPNPTVQVGQQELTDRQFANVGDAIEDIPLVGIGGNTRGANTQNGDSFILPDILDIGSQRTLTLLNGRRIQPTLPGTVFVPGNASGSQVDLSVINPALVERVEVVAGTGGAVYGADAVGGVVNIITRDDYEGLELTLQGGITERGDGQQIRLGGIWGVNFLDDRANITVTADYFTQDLITVSQETDSRYQGTGITSPFDGGIRRPGFTAAAAADALRAGSSLTPFLPPGNAAVTDLTPTTYFFQERDLRLPIGNEAGVLLTRHQIIAGLATTQPLVPAVAVAGEAAQPGAFVQNGIALPFFSPTSLTGVGAGSSNLTSAQVFTALGLPNITGLSAAQQNTLALQMLQASRPTPFEYFAANPGLDPNLFIGTFGTVTIGTGVENNLSGFLPTIQNPVTTGAGARSIFPRIAVPLQFDASGNLVAYNPGDYGPNGLGLIAAANGGQGWDSFQRELAQVQAGTQRMSFGILGRYDITDYMRYRSELFYSDIEFEIIGAPQTSSSNGSTQAGTLAIPIYIDQNPFVAAGARTTINGLCETGPGVMASCTRAAGTGLALGTQDGQRVLFMGRTLLELFPNGTPTNTENNNYRVMQGLEGDFELLDRSFYWDLSAYYGRAETISTTIGVLDHNFHLAMDVVDSDPGPGVNPVCHQQTLVAPQSLTVRNPGTSAIVIHPGIGLVPTAATIAACVPMNVFGPGNISQAAIDYVTTEQVTSSINTLEVYAGSLGGEILRLPAGWLQIGAQYEVRRESAEFEPDNILLNGLTGTALQFTGGGTRDFTEYGYEVLIPIFGEGFNFPLMQELELSYAWRFVERSQETKFFITNGTPTEDDTFNYSFRWKPVDDITLRGARGRTVRSASLVELFDPGIRAFGGVIAQTHPCDKDNVGSGPSPAVRLANCAAAVVAYGIRPDTASALTFLSTFDHTAGAPNRPATAVGNPFLANEESDAYTYGITWEPSFIPRLLLAVDFFSLDLSGELGLVVGQITAEACFDSTAYPNSIIGSNNFACDANLYVLPNGTIPAVNPITGNVTPNSLAFGGQAANPAAPFEVASIDFLNLNQGSRELRAINWEARYNFPLADLPILGGAMENWGDMFIRATVFHTQRHDQFQPVALNRSSEEHGFAEYEARFDIRHRVGPFDQTLQWFWTSETYTNIQTVNNTTVFLADQAQTFLAPDYHYFNYNAAYDVTDNMTLRLTINNLADTEEPRGNYGLGNNQDFGIGREFIIGANVRF